MTEVFVLRNHDGLFLDKHGSWVDGGDAASLYRTPHKDEALNQKLECTVRNPDLRIHVINCSLDDKGRPFITAERPTAEAL